MKILDSLFYRHIREIKEDGALRFYGAALCVVPLLTIYFWFYNETSYRLVMTDPLAICWPFFQSCDIYRSIDSQTWVFIAVAWAIMSVIAMVSFFNKRTVALGYWLLMFSNLIKFTIFISEFRVMGNYHYMPFFTTWVYLFFRNKKIAVMLILASFYVSAGLLKLDTEWLHGAAFLRRSFAEGELLEWMLTYVILFEVVGPWLMLSNNLWLFLAFYFQFIFFHAFSWHIVGYYYPLNMFAILSAFLLFRFKRQGNTFKFLPREQATKTTMAFLVVFLFANVVPRIIYPDLAITGKGRLLALNMLDARVHCHHFSYIEKANEIVEVSSKRKDLAVRIKCDPLVFFEEAQEICKTLEPGEKLATHLVSRKRTHKEWVKVFSYNDFCGENIKMNWYGDYP